jgi:hypothetical protein
MTTAPTPAHEPTTQERLTWMRKNSKRLIIALILILVAAAVVTFSFSLFSSSSASPGNMVSTGSIAINSSAEGTAIFKIEGLLPGESGTGTVTVTNVGDSDGAFTLTASNLVDTPASPALSSQLTAVVTDETSAQVYSGPLASLSTVALGNWAADETHTYTFTVTFAASADNTYQDAQTTLDLTWTAGQTG